MLKFLVRVGIKKNPSSIQESIGKLRIMEETLEKKVIYLDCKIEEKSSAIRELMKKGDKSAAMKTLKERKRLEKQHEQTSRTLESIKVQRTALENSIITTAVVKSMKEASRSFKSSGVSNVDDVHDIMDDVSEQMDLIDEVTQAISGACVRDQEDEDELEKELDDFSEETQISELLNIEVENKEPERVTAGEDEDEVKLAKWLIYIF